MKVLSLIFYLAMAVVIAAKLDFTLIGLFLLIVWVIVSFRYIYQK